MNPIQIQQLFHHLHWQSQKLLQLEQSMDNLHHELEAFKKNPTPTVDKIEYNFDQLKIEKLEGTLNIGITPEAGKSIEDLSVNGKTIEERSMEMDNQSLQFRSIQKNIDHFLNTDVPSEIEKLSKHYTLELNPEQRAFIIEDLKKQIDERILYYYSTTTVAEKVKKDITRGLHQYMNKLSESERESE